MTGPRPVVVSFPRRRLVSEADCLRYAREAVAAQRAHADLTAEEETSTDG